MSDNYIDVDSSDDSLSGFVVHSKKHKKSSKHDKKRKRESDDESLGSVDTDDDFKIDGNDDESPVEALLNQMSQYFALDIGNVRKQIKKRIKKNLPQLPSDRVKSLTKSIVESLDQRFLSIRAGVKPSDKSWRLDLSRDEIDQLKPIFRRIRDRIAEKMPTVQKILRATVPISNKTDAMQQFDILQNKTPYTDEWLDIIKKINRMIKHDPTITPEQIVTMDAEEARLELITPDHDQEFKDKIYNLVTTDRIKSIILSSYNDMMHADESHHEHIRKKLQYMIKLPYEKQYQPFESSKLTSNVETLIEDNEKRHQLAQYLEGVRSRLDERLYGMDSIKHRIMNMIHNRIFSNRSHSILCLKGPPGVGKTALASAIAYACGVPFDKISAAGINDPSVFTGSGEVWMGSQPGVIVRTLCKLGINNPVILIDELDKADGGHRGDAVKHSILETLDIEQNSSAKDLYIHEYDHDFSRIFWIVSVNDDSNIHPALKSRLDIVNVEPYTTDELIQITRNYVLPAELKTMSLALDRITISDEAIETLVKYATKDDVDVRIIRNMIRAIVLNLNALETYRLNPPTVERTGPTMLRFKRTRFGDVKDFRGFPYCITSETIGSIINDNKKTTLSYYS